MLYNAKLWKNSLCIAFLLIPMFGKSESTLFLMKIQTVSVKNRSFVHLIFPRIRLQNKAQFDVGFSERLKLKQDAVPTILDSTTTSHHRSVSNCFVTSYRSLELFMRFWPKSQQRPSMRNVTKVLANHSSGRLLPSLQSATYIQTECSDEGGQKQDQNIDHYF